MRARPSARLVATLGIWSGLAACTTSAPPATTPELFARAALRTQQPTPQEPAPAESAPPEPAPQGNPQGDPQPAGPIHDLSQDPYRTPRAGEGFRANVFGEEIVEGPRDRRKIAAWDVGFATAPRVDGLPLIPFGSLYFWHRPDDDNFARAIVVGVFNEITVAKSPSGWGDFEFVWTWENFTVPVATSDFVDGESLEQTSLLSGTLRPGYGFGFRKQVGPYNDNMFEANIVGEPGLLYFARGDETGPNYQAPQTTLELRAKARVRLDMIERNLLELGHSGFAIGADLTYGYRVNWEDWGDATIGQGGNASETRDYLNFNGYAVGITGVPFLGDRHRLVGAIHGGIGDDVDRWSATRVGGGPDPRASEYGAISRPIVPGAAIGEFFPEHYLILYGGYRFEPIFFAYLDVGGSIAWLDRDHLQPSPTFVNRTDDRLRSVGARLTSGFVGRTRIQLLYAYNFDVIRDAQEGGFEVTFHISGAF